MPRCHRRISPSFDFDSARRTPRLRTRQNAFENVGPLQAASRIIPRVMPLTAGTRLGPYEVIAPIGAGGMGEVYSAKDTRLDRTVALKILPLHLADTPEVRQRFEREARAVSSLNHPNICALYDIGQQDGTDFLVMEYLEGQTLAKRIEQGPMPTPELLRVAIQVCEALEKAPRQAHRARPDADAGTAARGHPGLRGAGESASPRSDPSRPEAGQCDAHKSGSETAGFRFGEECGTGRDRYVEFADSDPGVGGQFARTPT